MARGNAAARKAEAAEKARAKKDAKQAAKVSKQQKKNEAVFEKALSKFSNTALDSAAGTNGKKKRESHVFRRHSTPSVPLSPRPQGRTSSKECFISKTSFHAFKVLFYEDEYEYEKLQFFPPSLALLYFYSNDILVSGAGTNSQESFRRRKEA